MFTARTKIVKERADQEPTELEDDVAKALFELQEQAEAEMKVYLRDLAFESAKEVEVTTNKKAVIIQVPYRLLPKYHKRLLTNACLQTRLVRELEKKFSGRIVVIIGKRRILRQPLKKERLQKQKRPRSRTLTAVHDAILEDLVYPTQVRKMLPASGLATASAGCASIAVARPPSFLQDSDLPRDVRAPAQIFGKRTTVSVDGTKTLKVLLDPNAATQLEYKLDAFATVYKKLTNKDAIFEFPHVTVEDKH